MSISSLNMATVDVLGEEVHSSRRNIKRFSMKEETYPPPEGMEQMFSEKFHLLTSILMARYL